jgi:ubiquinone/menaquinone biosynthesis C-methylase UbiE
MSNAPPNTDRRSTDGMTNEPAPFDPGKFKESVRGQWDASAKGWNDRSAQIREWLRGATEAMLDMAEIAPGARVLDVAAGAGDQTLDIAQRVGPGGSVLATDLSPAILEFAEANARRAGYGTVETRVADGEELDIAEAGFDAAVCRLGLMLFPNPAKGLAAMFRVLKPGGMACTLVFGAPAVNPCMVALVSTALKHAGLPPRDPYLPGGILSLGKPGLIDALFRQAGFEVAGTRSLAAPFRLPSVKDYVDFIRTSGGPILAILGRLNETQRAAAWAEMEEKLNAFNRAGAWEGPHEFLLTAGRR